MTDSFTLLMRDAGSLPCQSAPTLFFEQDMFDEDKLPVGTTARFNMAKKLCWECPIRKACGQYAVENQIEFGVWGALTPKERAKLFKT